ARVDATIGGGARGDADDIGQATAGGQDTPRAATDDDRRRGLVRQGLKVAQRVVLAGERIRRRGIQYAFDHLQVLVEARDAGRRQIVVQAGLDVLALGPTGADAELEAIVRQQLHGRGFPGQDRRRTEVLVQYVRREA